MKLTESKILKIIREEVENLQETDVSTMMMGAAGVAGLYGLYKLFFGSNPSSEEEAVQRIRDHVEELQIKANSMRKPGVPPADEFQAVNNMSKLKKLRKQYNKET